MMRTRQKLVMAELDLDRSDQFPKRGLGRHTDGSDLRGLRLERRRWILRHICVRLGARRFRERLHVRLDLAPPLDDLGLELAKHGQLRARKSRELPCEPRRGGDPGGGAHWMRSPRLCCWMSCWILISFGARTPRACWSFHTHTDSQQPCCRTSRRLARHLRRLARATAARCCLGAALGGAALLAVGVGRGADPRRRLFETHAAAWVEALVAFLMLVTLTVLAVVVRKFAALGEDEGSGGARARGSSASSCSRPTRSVTLAPPRPRRRATATSRRSRRARGPRRPS